jgi:hypothetical protein
MPISGMCEDTKDKGDLLYAPLLNLLPVVYLAMKKSTTGSGRRSTRKSAGGKSDFRPPDVPAGRQVVEHSPNGLEAVT